MQQSESHIALVAKIRRARTGAKTHHQVWAFLTGDENSATPIVVTVEIHANGTWLPIEGHEVPYGPEIPVEQLRGDRVWWGPWARRYAAALLEVHRSEQHAQADQAQAVAWLNDEDGDREIRVIRTFPAPRGYGEGV